MIVIELKDFEVYRPSGQTKTYLFATLWDEGDTDMNAEILAEYEIEIYEGYYLNYKITKKEYNEKLTIKQTQDCDDYITKIYDKGTFENAYIEELDQYDQDWSWFI